MRKPLLVIGILVALVYACNQNNSGNALLRISKLPSQFFSLNITKDTTLVTAKGAVIRIPKGALAADEQIVRLEVKEAYSMQDIIKAGLVTQSNGQPLSSGGMIFIDAAPGNKVTIKQKLSIATPTPFIDSAMQLFKGEVKADCTVNWANPQPLPANPQLTLLDKGKVLFNDNCASCHGIGWDGTGPNMAHIMKHYEGHLGEAGIDLYGFIKNPAKIMANEGYYQCQKRRFGGSMMTAFPKLTNEDIDLILAYVENESDRRNLPMPANDLLACRDSCRLYNEVSQHWKQIKAELEKDSSNMVEEKNTASSIPIEIADIPVVIPTVQDLSIVNPYSSKSLYYQFEVSSFGWYNVDQLMKNNPNLIDTELKVQVKGAYGKRFQLYLVVPSVKLFAQGGPLENSDRTYGFFETNGNIPLPQKARAYILAVGEYEDKIIFAKQEFIIQQRQSFIIEPAIVSVAEFDQQITAMQLSDLNIKVSDTKNSKELRNAIREMEKAEGLKPKNCDCNCFIIAPSTVGNIVTYSDPVAAQSY